MNSKEVALFFGLVAIVLLAMVAVPFNSNGSNAVASGFIPNNNQVEKFYVGPTEDCQLWECKASGIHAECKCIK